MPRWNVNTINSCGKGWLVLRLYNEYVNRKDTRYQQDNCLDQKESRYSHLIKTRDFIWPFLTIEVILGNKTIRHEGSNTDFKEIKKLANKILEVI